VAGTTGGSPRAGRVLKVCSTGCLLRRFEPRRIRVSQWPTPNEIAHLGVHSYRLVVPPVIFDFLTNQLYHPFVFQNCPCNVLRSIEKRVDLDLHEPDDEAMASLRRLVNLAKRLGVFPKVRSSTDQELFARSGAMREKLERGRLQYLREGLSNRDMSTDMFIKAEATKPKTSEGNLAAAAPRPIYSIPDKLCYLGALHYHNVEAAQLKVRGRPFPNSRSILKGLNTLERAALIRKKFTRFSKPVFQCVDGVKCDAHIGRKLLKIQHSVDLYMNSHPTFVLLQRLTEGRWRIRSRDGFKFLAPSIRLTGAWDTGGGNSLLHLLILCDLLKEIPLEKWDVGVDGDNFFVIANQQDFAEVQAALRGHVRYGVEFEWDPPSSVFEELEFCRHRPVEVQSGVWNMVRSPWRTLSHFTCPSEDLRNLVWNHAHTVADGEYKAFAGIPFIGAFFKWLSWQLRNVPLYEGKIDPWVVKRWKEAVSVPVDLVIARQSFARAWSITEGQQLALENLFVGSLPMNTQTLAEAECYVTSPDGVWDFDLVRMFFLGGAGVPAW
jgi:hypothetical protein